MVAWTAPTTLPRSGPTSKTSVSLLYRVATPRVGARVLRRVAGLLIDRVMLRPVTGRFGLVVTFGRLLGGNLEESHSDHPFQCAV
jgi:hypothetical protein